MSTSRATSRAEAPALAAPTWLRSMPMRTTGRSVTRASPPAPRMSPRLAPSPTRSMVTFGPRVGSMVAGSQSASHSSPVWVSVACEEYCQPSGPSGHAQSYVAVAVAGSPDGSETSARVTVGVRSSRPSTTVAYSSVTAAGSADVNPTSPKSPDARASARVWAAPSGEEMSPLSGGVLASSPVHAVRLVRARKSPVSWTRTRRRRMASVYQTTPCDPDHNIPATSREESGPRSGSID